MIEVDQLKSGIRVSASSKKHLVGRLGSGPRVVGQEYTVYGLVPIFQIFALAVLICGEGNCQEGGTVHRIYPTANVQEECLKARL